MNQHLYGNVSPIPLIKGEISEGGEEFTPFSLKVECLTTILSGLIRVATLFEYTEQSLYSILFSLSHCFLTHHCI